MRRVISLGTTLNASQIRCCPAGPSSSTPDARRASGAAALTSTYSPCRTPQALGPCSVKTVTQPHFEPPLPFARKA